MLAGLPGDAGCPPAAFAAPADKRGRLRMALHVPPCVTTHDSHVRLGFTVGGRNGRLYTDSPAGRRYGPDCFRNEIYHGFVRGIL